MLDCHLQDALTLARMVQQDTAPITLQLGGVSDGGQVEHGTLSVVDAPARFVDALHSSGFSLAVRNGRLVVDAYSRRVGGGLVA